MVGFASNRCAGISRLGCFCFSQSEFCVVLTLNCTQLLVDISLTIFEVCVNEVVDAMPCCANRIEMNRSQGKQY